MRERVESAVRVLGLLCPLAPGRGRPPAAIDSPCALLRLLPHPTP